MNILNTSNSKQILYNQNLELMNQFLAFKNQEVSKLESKISIKDQLYKQFFDFATDAFIISSNWIISYSNKALLKLLDAKDSTSVVGRSLWEFIHPTSMAKVHSTYSDLIEGMTDTTVVEADLLSLNNQVVKVSISSRIVTYENDHYVVSSFSDLSLMYEEKRIKDELKKDVANEKLKVEFFANISHDLKTPINVIYSATQLQDIYAHSNDYENVLVYNDIIKRNCHRLQKLLNDVLDISKIDANFCQPQFELINIISTIEYITQSIISYVENKNISIVFDTNIEDKMVRTDPNFIERIMFNLISNAIKYGKLDGHVWVALFDEGDHLIISVKDNGIGIAKDQIPNIFKRFHKAQNSHNNSVRSNGIGLSLVKSMVEILDGQVFCLSTEGLGSEFVVILPLASHNSGGDSYCCEYATSLELSNKLKVELSDI